MDDVDRQDGPELRAVSAGVRNAIDRFFQAGAEADVCAEWIDLGWHQAHKTPFSHNVP